MRSLMFYDGDKIEFQNGELLIDDDFIAYVDYEYEYWSSLESYYAVDQNLIALYSSH